MFRLRIAFSWNPLHLVFIYLGSSFVLLVRLSRLRERRFSLLGDRRRARLLDRLRSPLPRESDLLLPLLLDLLLSLLLDLLRRSLDRRLSLLLDLGLLFSIANGFVSSSESSNWISRLSRSSSGLRLGSRTP